MIALHRIKWSGYSSIDLDLIIDCCFDPDSGETSSFLNREAVATDSYRGDYRRIHNFKYNEFFTPKFTFIKRGFGDFSADDYRRLMSWLTSKSTTGVLTAYRDDSEVVEFECIGNWGDIQPYKIANHRTVGVTAVFETTSPWAYSPIKTVTATITQPTILNIECNTDDWDTPVYPKITIEQSNDIVVNITKDMADGIFNNNNYIDGTVYHYNGKYYWKNIGDTYYTKTIEVTSSDTETFVGDDVRYYIPPTPVTMLPTSINSSDIENLVITCDSGVFTTNYAGNGVVLIQGYLDTYSAVASITIACKIRKTSANKVVLYENDVNSSQFYTTSVSLYNETVELETYVKGNTANETIIIDGTNKLITTESKARSVIGNDFSFKWLPLVRGENKIHIIGNCTITFEWREPIKLGEY